MEYPGPLCKSAGICFIDTRLKVEQKHSLTNGLVLELWYYSKEKGHIQAQLCEFLKEVDGDLADVKSSSIISRIDSIISKKKKLKSKKKVQGVKNVEELLSQFFCVVKREKLHPETNSTTVPVSSDVTKKGDHNESAKRDAHCITEKATQTEIDCENDIFSTKEWNLNKYAFNRQTKALKKVNEEINKSEEKLQTLSKRVGHYAIKNINKRDETGRQNLKNLRKSQRSLGQSETERKKLKLEVKDLQEKKTSSEVEAKTLRGKLKEETIRKLAAQKCNYKLRLKVGSLKEKIKIHDATNDLEISRECEQNEQILVLKDKLAEKDLLMSDLEEEIKELKAKKIIVTKNPDGSYCDTIRLCVIQLAGLEVAVEKVSSVINVVADTLFKQPFDKDKLPNKTTVQTIVDEGQYVAKAYIAERLYQCDSWGLNRDGTSRKKKKIVGTAITLDTGEVTSLGFTQVARETGKAIVNVTQNHLEDIAAIHSNGNEKVTEDYIVSTLSKLTFTMSDRASNEKLADKLLNEWRDEMLLKCSSENEKSSVKNFHCMAHVLLGFHKYICDDLKPVEKELATEHGPLGKDAVPQFRFWRNTGTVVERAVRTTSNTFGPAGDYLGLRDRWEAYCADKGIKSTIGNYKDNRFNGLFQTAAEIIVHRSDFLEVINTVQDPNGKIKAVAADIQSTPIINLLLALALIFIRITGPYWNLVTNGNVPYLELYEHIQNLHSCLKECSEDPYKLIHNNSCSWTESENFEISNKDRIIKAVLSCEKDNDILCMALKSMCQSMVRTVEKQLKDFLPDGQFAMAPSEKNLKQTMFANVTNLSVEHHFGDLDSSQKRRPNASFHHHTSIQLLKRNKTKIQNWYKKMNDDQKKKLWKRARKAGKQLREEHIKQQKRVHADIYESMLEKPKKRQKVLKKNHDVSEEEQICFPSATHVKVNDYVVVAYQDRWYPGSVTEKNDNNFVVNFMCPTQRLGIFTWPGRTDIQCVKSDFVIDTGMIPECISSGRQWSFPEHAKYEELYQQYKKLFF